MKCDGGDFLPNLSSDIKSSHLRSWNQEMFDILYLTETINQFIQNQIQTRLIDNWLIHQLTRTFNVKETDEELSSD